MTTIITLYLDSADTASAVRYELIYRQRSSYRFLALRDSADGLADRLAASHVEPETARSYEEKMRSGGAVLLVRAGHKPLAVAKKARATVADMCAQAGTVWSRSSSSGTFPT